MNAALMPALHRTLAVSILLSLLLVSWFLLVLPLIDLVRDRHADIDALSSRLAHLQAIIARKPELEQRDLALKARLANEGGFWSGASPAAIAASVQDRLRRIVTGAGGLVKSASELRAATDQDAPAVRLRFRIEGPLETIQATLEAIETMRPALFVDGFSIVAPDRQGTAGDKPPVLAFDLEVSGFMAMGRP